MNDADDSSPEDASEMAEGVPSSASDKTGTTPGDGAGQDSSIAAKKNELPPQRFFPTDKVIARDRDGVMYQAVVRRAIYGSGRAEQLQLGLFSSDEVKKLQAQACDTPPCWHYFIHFLQWRTNFDSWVRDCDIYPVEENIQQYSAAVLDAHRKLRNEMASKFSGPKPHLKIDGNKFLQEWRKRVTLIDAEFNVYNPRFGGPPASANKAKGSKTTGRKHEVSADTAAAVSKKTTMMKELQLRQSGLTEMNASSASRVSLSFGLKRAMVEQWEIINQCGMVTHLPSSVTIRHALNEYLKSKGVDPEICDQSSEQLTKQTVKMKKDEEDTEESRISSGSGSQKPEQGSESLERPQDTVSALQATPLVEKNEPSTVNASSEVRDTSCNASQETDTSHLQQDQPDSADPNREDFQAQGWIDMVNGVAQFFDEALPVSLLYREEYPQFRVIQRSEEFADKRYSEIYGCEHLLRLFARLPDLLVEELSSEDCRPLLAKLNDLTRYLHKNQSILMAAYHRKPNREENAEALRMENRLKVRKKRQVDASSQQSRKEKKIKGDTDSKVTTVDLANANDEGTKASESVSTAY